MVKKTIFLIFLILLSTSVFAAENDCILYFHSEACQTCDDIAIFLEDLKTKYPDLRIEEHEVYHFQEKAQHLNQFFNAYEVPQEARGIPTIITSGTYFTGKKAIEELLEGRIIENTNQNCPTIEDLEMIGVTGEDVWPSNVLEVLAFGTITGAALVDGFSQGMLALALLLVLLMLLIPKDSTLIKRGAIFALFVYIVFFLKGLGLWSGFGTTANLIFYKTIAVIAFFAGILGIRFFLGSQKKWFNLPEKTQKMLEKVKFWISSIWGFIVLAILGSFFAISDTHWVHELLINVYSAGSLRSVIFPALLYYTLIACIVILGIIITTAIAHTKVEDRLKAKQKEKQKIEMWQKHYHKILHFICSCVLAVVGLILVIV